eukprot:10550957-Lingulodinium_polyedra.AAC.1
MGELSSLIHLIALYVPGQAHILPLDVVANNAHLHRVPVVAHKLCHLLGAVWDELVHSHIRVPVQGTPV